jgi:hypothetical protein
VDDRINRAPVDRYTPFHTAAGVGAAAVGLPWYVTLLASLAFEVVENGVQHRVPSIFANSSANDSLPNAVCDTLAVMLGWAAVDVLRSR